jgi:DNA mismatch repair protein MutS
VSAREHAGNIVFFHKVQRGAASRSYGVACARLAGLPEPVLARARAILGSLERGAASPAGGGKPARGKRAPQLDLFGSGGAGTAANDDVAQPAPTSAAIEMLLALDLDRMTPLEALSTLAKLKGLAEPT